MTISELDRARGGQDQRETDRTDGSDGTVGAGRALAWLLVVTGAVGLAAAFVLSIEKIKLLEDPSYVPSCSLNPVLSCGSVMKTWQASAFGFPNMFMGLAGYAVVMAVGVALLAGARFQRWFWVGVQLGATFGVGFIHWLVFQSLYRIGALCPYCMVAWAATIPMFVYVTLHSLKRGVIPLPAGGRKALDAVLEFHWVVVLTWYLVIAMLILTRFWSYWKTLL
ncbi:vitamin K epoxide reductase family protein [Wenjunlia tyrosinilytica]|nr:vitamin K epoxide reductase family protein [Wenjunlia tyrosinilytica]